jgi:LacI family transcriptional regulator
MSQVDGEMANRSGRVTIRDVAARAGVSIATVSRVLNGRHDVSPKTREAVLEVVRLYGFTTSRSARDLSAGRTGIVGITLPPAYADYASSSVLSGAAEALCEQDTRILLCPPLNAHDQKATLFDQLMRGATDGAILISASNEDVRTLAGHNFPFVVVDPREEPPGGIPVVTAAHLSGAKAATEHLLALGHRRIAAITGPPASVASDELLSGFRAALAAAGVRPDPKLEVAGELEIEGGFVAALTLLDRAQPPSAVFAFNDDLAFGVVRAARTHDLRVPEDLSVVGFDDQEYARLVTPALTTVRQPFQEMGRMAVSLLTRLLERHRVEALRVELATTLVVRDSTRSLD